MLLLALILTLVMRNSAAQPISSGSSNTFPHDYPGKPTGDFGPNWQTYYQVKDPLPGVDFAIPHSFAGNIPTNRPNHPNCTLFFWAFEQSPGSLASNASTSQPWTIWLNGGPGVSSFLGLFFENGPMQITPDFSVVPNKFSWSNLSDIVYVDQPCSTGFSTADSKGRVPNEDVMAEDFIGFLSNLVKIFPSLATRPLYLTGESYAGVYIPYITKALFGTAKPPVKLAKIAIGDGVMASTMVAEDTPTVQIIETYPQLIGFDQEVYAYFKQQQHLCGYDINLTYPQNGKIPVPIGTVVRPEGNNDPEGPQRIADTVANRSSRRKTLIQLTKLPSDGLDFMKRDTLSKSHKFKRSLAGRTNGSIDETYGCFTLDMLSDYALNFTFPWARGANTLDIYDVPDALSPEMVQDASIFLNNPATRAAIHAPTSKNWSETTMDLFASNGMGDPSEPPMNFFDELFANASKLNVGIIIYSGNDDMLVAHFGSELTIQNTTWGGVQGFSQQPSTPWYNDRGEFAGIVHQERNVTYVLFKGAGHTVPQYQPENAYVFMREFVLGNNATGLLGSDGKIVQGGSSQTLLHGVLPEYTQPIFFGAGTTASSTIFPSATIAAWESAIGSATSPSSTASGSMIQKLTRSGFFFMVATLVHILCNL